MKEIQLPTQASLDGAPPPAGTSPDKLRTYVEQLPVAVAVFRGAGQVFDFVNAAYCDLIGRPSTELLGQSLFTVYPELKGTATEYIHQTVWQTGRPQEVREQPIAFQRNGQLHEGFFNVNYQPLKNAVGQAEGVIVVGYEVTELVRDKKTLAESQQQASRLADAMPQVVWMAESDGAVTYYNQRVSEFAGATQNPDGKWHWEGVVHPDDLAATLEAWQWAVATGRVYEHEHRVHMRDGSYRWHLSRGVPQVDADGAITGWVGTATNIDEQKGTEQALRESEERFRTLAEALPHLVWTTDAQGAYEYASRQWQAYSGLDPTQPDTWVKMVHPDDLAPLMQTWLHCVQSGQTYKVEVRLRRRDGAFRWHSVHGEPVRNEAGQIVRWIGAFADIHEQKTFAEQLETLVAQRTQALYESNQFLEERNAQLQLANKELESFNYVVSHDLQEPLRKIQAFISFLERKNTSEAKRAELLNRIDVSARRMSDLLHGILNYSRLTNPENEFVATDLNTILAQIRSDYELILEEKNATLESDILPTVRAIPLQMSQLLANLLSNALKFADKPPRIAITATELSGEQLPPMFNPPSGQRYAAIAFRDNGIGFEPHYAPKIFTLFQRLHARQTYDGTGIGLTICKKIVENHDGFITADGRPGEGATFTVYLPVEQPEKEPQFAEKTS